MSKHPHLPARNLVLRPHPPNVPGRRDAWAVGLLAAVLALILALWSMGCSRFRSTVTERIQADGAVERITIVHAGTLLDSKSELAKLSSGQTEKSQKVSIGSLNQESAATNAASLVEAVVGAAVRAAVRP